MAAPAEGFSRLLGFLDKLEIPYSGGGSAAGSVHGVPRTAHDNGRRSCHGLARQPNDGTGCLTPNGILCGCRDNFCRYRPGTILCVIHVASAYRFDLLRKLEWYRADGEASERQWNDVRGVRKVSGGGRSS